MTPRRGCRRVLVLGLVCFGALVAFVVACGRVTSTEFSPRSFEHRSVLYYHVPLIELRVTPRWTTTWGTPLATFLGAEGHLEPMAADADWSLVKGFAWGVAGWHGPAKHLCQTIGCWASEDARWVAWSREHPEVASDLWPIVVRSARSRDFAAAALAVMAADGATTRDMFQQRLALLRGR